MRVLVTGGSGFIGSHVVDKLLAAGHEPVNFDLRPSPHHSPDEVETVIGDLLDSRALEGAMGDCDAVIHLAAAADVGIVAEQPEEAERVNARGTLAVLEAARASGIGRVIYGSTIWAYGDSGNGVIDEDTLLGLPKHLYTASKVAGEMYCTSYSELYDVPCTILRFGIPYGPRARPSAVIPIFVRKALAGEPLTIAGDGSQGRRFVYVEDLAEGVARALDAGTDNRIYNLASDTTVTILELAETVRDLVGDAEIVHTPGRNGDFDGAEISSLRAERELGWRASTPLREGVGRYIAWLAANPTAQPAPVRAPEPAVAVAEPPSAVAEPPVAVAEPAPVRRRRWSAPAWPTGLLGDGPTMAFACAVATLITYVIALRTRSLDDAQTHAVGLTTIVATLIGLILLQAASMRRFRTGVTWALWLVALYAGLLTLHWTKQRLELALPGLHTLVLSGFGMLIALAVAMGIARWRRESAASDEIL